MRATVDLSLKQAKDPGRFPAQNPTSGGVAGHKRHIVQQSETLDAIAAREYGQRVGVYRMFDMFDEVKVKPSCTINAVTALRRRPMLEAALARGCEILAHNYEQGELLTDFAADPAKERDVIERTLKVYEQHVGRKARGWLSSSLRGTLNTAVDLGRGYPGGCPG